MWEDVVITNRGLFINGAQFNPGKKFCKGGKTRYIISVFQDEYELRHNKEDVFYVSCKEVGINARLKITNLEDAKKEALLLVQNKYKEKLSLANEFYNILKNENHTEN